MSSDTTQTTLALRRQLDDGTTGRLTTREPSGKVVDVYVMNGAVVAAHAEDDPAQLVRRLVILGTLDEAHTPTLISGSHDGSIADKLHDFVPEEGLIEVLFSRFKDNLTRFLSSPGRCVFSELEAIFVSNLQFSHDTSALLAEAEEVLARTSGLTASPADQVRVALSSQPATLPTEKELVRRVPSGGCTLEELLKTSPFETHETLDLLADMLQRGALVAEGAQAPILAAEAPSSQDSEPLPPEPAPPPDEDAAPITRPMMRDLSFQSTPDEHLEDDELAMFADHDQERGGLGDGQFSGEVRDRVDLSDVLVPHGNMLDKFTEEDVEPLEMGEADGSEDEGPVDRVQMKFTEPRLTDQEALRKLQVVNGVLEQLAKAFDAAQGSGGGQAQIQLLLDGSPGGYSLLFYKVEARHDGTINPNAVVHNLQRRPVAEHRRLLNNGLLNMIERALSAACESLDDDTLDSVLESIAGYQQAIGL